MDYLVTAKNTHPRTSAVIAKHLGVVHSHRVLARPMPAASPLSLQNRPP